MLKGEMTLENCIEHDNRLTKLEEEIENLEEWQKRQNGTLQKIQEELEEQLKTQRTILGGLVVSLILLILNLIIGRF